MQGIQAPALFVRLRYELVLFATYLTGPPIRSAAKRPDMRTIGTPTPGWVPLPAKTTFSKPAAILLGRKGPV